MRKRHLIVFLFLLIISDLTSQIRGNFFINNYNRKEYDASIANWSITQDSLGKIYAANYDGVLEYNGKSWSLISLENNTKALSIATDENNKIYVGSERDFGYLKPNELGKLIYTSLKNKLPSNTSVYPIWKILTFNGKVYFYSSKQIYVLSENKIKVEKPTNNELFIPILTIRNDKKLSVNKKKAYIELIKKHVNSLENIPINNSSIRFFEKNENSSYILGIEDGTFFNISTKSIIEIPNNGILKTKLQKKTLLKGIYIPSQIPNSFAFGTIQSEGIILSNNFENYSSIINKESGLQSEIIRDLYIDLNNNLWSSMQIGISQIEISSPWSFWNDKLNSIGTPWNIIRSNNKIYIATTKGLFTEKNNELIQVKDVNSKVWSLTKHNNSKNPNKDQLYIGSIKGLFKKSNTKISKILDFRIISKIHYSEKNNILLIGHGKGISFLRDNKGNVSDKQIITLNINTYYDAIEHNNNFWISSKFTGIYKISDINSKKPKVTLYNTNNGLKDVNQISIIKKDNQLLFCTDNGIYNYNENNSDSLKFTPDSTIIKERVSIKLAKKDSFGNFWFAFSKNRKHRFEQYIKNLDGSFTRNQIPFRRLPDSEIIDIYPENDSVVWFATSSGLYRYDPKIPKDYTLPFNTHIRKTITSDSVIFFGHYYDPDKREEVPSLIYEQPEAFKPSLTFDNNNITFEYSATFFEVAEKNQFSYFLENNDKHWSHWSTSTKKEYNNLSAGKYKFHVKSKNIYDTIGKTATYEFTILPPWYQTAWAYFLFTITGLMFVALVAYVYSYRIRMQRRKLKLVVADRTFEVLSQKKEIEQQHQLLKSKNEEIKSQSDDIQKKNQQLENHQEEILTINSMLTEMNATLERTVERRTSKIKSTLKILQKTNKELDTFVYRASHDLKGPISRIMGLISLIKYEARNDTKYGQYFDLIESNSEEMEVLLSKLTEVHEIFNKEVQSEEILFNELIIEARNKFSSQENELPPQFNFDLDKDSNFKSDYYILKVIISKVLENALIFRKSPKDLHKIEISSSRRGRIFHFKIKDYGDGIDAEIKEKIYDMFFRGSEKSKGNGLGLYIVKMGLEKLGGKISLKTEANNFTEFTISIPVG